MRMIFSCLAWAGYLKDWPGPEESERPTGYIIILGDTEIAKDFGCNHGIAAQSILLGATEMGFGGCMIASIQRNKLAELLKIPPRYEILLVSPSVNRKSVLSLLKQKMAKLSTGGMPIKPTMCRNALKRNHPGFIIFRTKYFYREIPSMKMERTVYYKSI